MVLTALKSAPDLSVEKVHHEETLVTLRVSPPWPEQGEPLQGNVVVCESHVYFYSDAKQTGFALPYPDMCIHAISRHEGQPSIYCQLSEGVHFPGQELPEDDENISIVELWFTLHQSESLDAIYKALCDCAELHPDPQSDEDEEGMFDNADDLDEGNLNEVQRAALRHLESVFEAPSNGFPPKDQQDQS